MNCGKHEIEIENEIFNLFTKLYSYSYLIHF